LTRREGFSGKTSLLPLMMRLFSALEVVSVANCCGKWKPFPWTHRSRSTACWLGRGGDFSYFKAPIF